MITLFSSLIIIIIIHFAHIDIDSFETDGPVLPCSKPEPIPEGTSTSTAPPFDGSKFIVFHPDVNSHRAEVIYYKLHHVFFKTFGTLGTPDFYGLNPEL